MQIHYTGYARPVEHGFEYGYIEQDLGNIDISKGVQGATIRAKAYHANGVVLTLDEALAKMQALPLRSFGGVADED